MTYYQTLIDDFDDNSFDGTLDATLAAPFSTRWRYSGNTTTLITETGQKLNLKTATTYPEIETKAIYDITAGILAVQSTRSGTATASCEYLFGVYDGDSHGGNLIQMLFTPSSTGQGLQAQGSATVSSEVDTGAGFNTAWTAGQWMGVGNLGSDNVLHFYKSTDGQTWTEIAHATIGGTFNKATSGLAITNGYYTVAESPTFSVAYDNASYWSQTPPVSGSTTHVRIGGVWVEATPKVRVAGAWVTATPKARSGGAWVASS